MTRLRITALVLALAASLAACGGTSPHSNNGRTFTITAASMEPTFKKGDKIVIADPPATLKVGMIVVFTEPSSWVFKGSKALTLVKRVLGVGGDRVSCCDAQGLIRINGVPIDESSYLPKGAAPSEDTFNVVVPAGTIWALGDNRENSYDSRFHPTGEGFVPIKNILGVVVKLKRSPSPGQGTDAPQP